MVQGRVDPTCQISLRSSTWMVFPQKVVSSGMSSKRCLLLYSVPQGSVNISKWICKNKLQLNEAKTELVMNIPSWQADKVDFESVQIGGSDIEPASSAHSLRATCDQQMTPKPHIIFPCQILLLRAP